MSKKPKPSAASQRVSIGFEDDKKSMKKVPRSGLNVDSINKLFACDVDFLKDNTGQCIFPKDWTRDCMAKPFKYYIIEKVLEDIIPDAAEEPEYEGDCEVTVLNVPSKVNEEALLAWIKKGLEAEDKGFSKATHAVKKCKAEIKKCQTRIENIPFMQTDATTEAGQAAERQGVTAYLKKEMAGLENQLVELEKNLDKQHKRKKKEEMQITLNSEDKVLKRRSYLVRFPGGSGEEMAYQAVHRENWKEVRLAIPPEQADDRKQLPPIAVVGDLPEKYLDYEVNMRLCRVARLHHGFGTFTFGDNEAYRGGWNEGKFHGRGTLYSMTGRFTGDFVCAKRRGMGKYEFATGDVYEGEFGVPESDRPDPVFLKDAFDQGYFHGNGKITYADGSNFVGEFVDGEIQGYGKFLNPATGEMKEGHFRRGQLHGQGIHVNAFGDRYEGEFQNDLLHGYGEFTAADGGDSYTGDFRHGEYQGRGVFQYGNKDLYDGYFYDGLRHGTGTFTYGNVQLEYDKRSGKTFRLYDFKYEGQWLCSKIRSRGLRATMSRNKSDLTSGDFMYYTTNGKSVNYPHLHHLHENDLKLRKKAQKRLKKHTAREAEERMRLEEENIRKYDYSRARAFDMYEVCLNQYVKESDQRQERLMRRQRSDYDDDDDASEDGSDASDADMDAEVENLRKLNFNINIADLLNEPPAELRDQAFSAMSGGLSELNYYRKKFANLNR